ncbi:MAG: hypothetical protein AUK34_08995 [Ignavibacteria bacterium CG2_30_36_16]|nr:hypothetical protein [Ignavibacteria bacterium]OIP58524.1 MAG: hypothetical protein AUK34_08995 [Ignavibacteria bacterium CG2_30_36_16]PJB01469.1 MAG: hypothetical protein CO127_03595 [Ignavibacteria bacterium CG_4_9_14_3_um_filter_36_18]
MNKFNFFVLVGLFSAISFSQSKIEEDIQSSFTNAKKGIYWALTNIPAKKTKIEYDLITDDKLIASIKLTKVINGIKIESTGYNFSNEVTIKIFKSYDNLVKEGYLAEKPAEQEKVENE